MFHIGIVLVQTIIKCQYLLTFLALVRLVKDAQNFVQPSIHLTVQTGNLHNDTVMR